MVENFSVNLSDRSYPIIFRRELSVELTAKIDEFVRAGRKIAVVTDRNLQAQQEVTLTSVFGNAPTLALAPGEETKSLKEFGRVLDFLAAQRLNRTGVLFAVGGGVIGDLAGFAAATYLRGIDFIQVPTTLLAMVDSSVGGKTGINLGAGKNLVGAFHQPRAVYVATGFLQTLPAREFAAGMAEVIKYGLLGDSALFGRLEGAALTATSTDLADVIRRCCELKARIVEADERELAADGGRALLNLGHTFGHAIEQVTGYGAYLHGEAVAIGLCAAARLSQKLGYLDAGQVKRTETVVAAHALPTRLRSALPLAELLAAMSRDKKVRADGLRFVVMKTIGKAATQSGIAAAGVEESFREVGAV